MPWTVVVNHPHCSTSKPFGVVNAEFGEVEGCHVSREAANRQMAALYASEERRAPMAETKAVGTVTFDIKAPSDGAEPGTFEAVLSTPTLDRDGEVVDPHAFVPLPEHITIDVDHVMTVAGIVGSGQPFYDGDTLKVRGSFSSDPDAQKVRTKIKEGHVRKMSVAFMNAEREEKDGVPHVVRAELLNAGIVAIASNREADILAVKAATTLGTRNSAQDAEMIQATHDLLANLGAACKHAAPGTTKTTDPETAAAPAAADTPAQVTSALVELTLVEADLAL